MKATDKNMFSMSVPGADLDTSLGSYRGLEASSLLYEAHLRSICMEDHSTACFDFDISTAYDVQDLVTLQKVVNNGEKVCGYKISLTSEETQSWFKASEPAYGTLTDRNFSKPYLDLKDLSEPLLEAELILIPVSELVPSMTDRELAANLVVAPGLEIPDSRFRNWFPVLPLNVIISDNSVAGKVVMGNPVKIPEPDDFARIRLLLSRDEKLLSEGISSTVLGNPLNSVRWLMNKLASRGEKLAPGMRISSGTLTLPVKLETGKYHAAYTMVGDVDLEVVRTA